MSGAVPGSTGYELWKGKLKYCEVESSLSMEGFQQRLFVPTRKVLLKKSLAAGASWSPCINNTK